MVRRPPAPRVDIGHFVSVVDADAVRLETHASRQYVL